MSEVEARAQQAADEAGKRIAKVETHQRELRRTALSGQVRGARLFIFGAVLSAVANVV